MTLATKSPSFPPVSEPLEWVKNIDWAKQRARARAGLNNCGIFIAVLGEKLNEFGIWLAEV